MANATSLSFLCILLIYTHLNIGALVRELGLSAGGHGSNQNNRNTNEVLEVCINYFIWEIVNLLRALGLLTTLLIGQSHICIHFLMFIHLLLRLFTFTSTYNNTDATASVWPALSGCAVVWIRADQTAAAP